MEKKFLEAIEKKSNLEESFSNSELKDLIDWSKKNEFTEGIYYTEFDNNTIELTCFDPRVRMEGKKYLKEIDNNQESYLNVKIINPEIKEIAEHLSLLNEKQKETLKLLVEKNEILDKIVFLKSDEITLMKMKFEELQKNDKSKAFPWDTINSVISIVSTLSTLNN